jgi:hypothetical protein
MFFMIRYLKWKANSTEAFPTLELLVFTLSVELLGIFLQKPTLNGRLTVRRPPIHMTSMF